VYVLQVLSPQGRFSSGVQRPLTHAVHALAHAALQHLHAHTSHSHTRTHSSNVCVRHRRVARCCHRVGERRVVERTVRRRALRAVIVCAQPSSKERMRAHTRTNATYALVHAVLSPFVVELTAVPLYVMLVLNTHVPVVSHTEPSVQLCCATVVRL
jgi:hypothetical protein